MYWVIAIAALGFLIVVHEAGHFFVARWCGMRVERFSIGFGPGILKRTAKSGTVFQLAPIPFGGYVEIRGMNLVEDIDPEDKEAYPNRPAWQRFATIFAGPGTNYLSAVFLAFGLYTCHGVDSAEQYYGVGAINKGYDAEHKLHEGDRILAIDGKPIYFAVAEITATTKPEKLRDRVNASGADQVTLTIRRDGKTFDVPITLKPGFEKDGTPILDDQKHQIRLLGIVPEIQVEQVDVGVINAVGASLRYPIDQTVAIGRGLYAIVIGEEKADVGGAPRIVEEFKKAFQLGWSTGLKLLMMLSVYLGLMNLFPLPALDGGRLVFLGYELITRRRANPKIESTVHMAGIMVLIVVMVLVTLHDFGLF
jgi:regulator of sigma E protease